VVDMKSPEGYHLLVELVQGDQGDCEKWRELLRLTGCSSLSRLTALDVNSEIEDLRSQLEKVWQSEPLHQDLTFVYFGLFDLADRRIPEGRAGFYVSGGTSRNPLEELTTSARLTYMPQSGQLRCNLLEQVKSADGEMPGKSEVLGYVVMLGGAALVVKGAIRRLNVSLPVYVGFDSGDVLSVSRGG
jgi:hypothetical protein